ncbi:hypothetical protein LOTGIDRAFT_228220 [Lottia gigantea]|uniref:Uncharacterized protein n=1 Tax=Lottia gigantea TaxID=225164 RepID=V4C7A7_LOTGI|nr:hypothetical protein LOTGIDRAFT_228220 [Lottia gigantea]ESO97569.1 hypothetical protein LOTGIDRAFT_228220 [Lottia gigantea]
MASVTIYMILILSVTSVVFSLSCVGCDKAAPCPLLPETKECFKARAPCACCDTCASGLGAECGALKIRCHPDYVCVNKDGVEKVMIPWFMMGFKGTCMPTGTGKIV